MKPMRIVLIAVLASLFLSACGLKDLQFQTPVTGSGRVISEERPAGSFERVQMSGFGELEITQGERESLTIQGEDNLLPYFLTSSSGGTLRIYESLFFTYQSSIPVRFRLTVRSLKGIDLSGFVKARATGLDANGLDVRLREFSSLAFDGLKANTLFADISGFSRLNVSGDVGHHTIRQEEQSVAQVDGPAVR